MKFGRILQFLLLAVVFGPATVGIAKDAPPKLPVASELKEVVGKADRLVVTKPLTNTTLFEYKSADLGAEFLGQFQIDEKAEWFHCMCHGEAWISFFAGEEKIATLGFHHARSLRWIGGPWSSDALLVGDTGIKLSQWFKEKGFPVFEDRRLADRARSEQRAAQEEAFSAQLSPGTRSIIHGEGAGHRRESTFARRAIAGTSDKAELCASVFRAFGQLPFESSGYDYTMSVCRNIIEYSASEDLHEALKRVEFDTQKGLRGAAWLFCAVNYLKTLPPGSGEEWAVKLAVFTLNAENDHLKSDALRRLAWTPGEQVDALLLAIASGERVFAYSAHERRNKYDDEPDLVSASCLALARRHHPQAKILCERRLQAAVDSTSAEALRVGLVLCGAAPTLEPAVFKSGSFLVGLSALQVLQEMPENSIPAHLLGAAMDASLGLVREEAEFMASKLKIGPAKAKVPDNNQEVDIDEELTFEDPAAAVTVLTNDLERGVGLTKARVLSARSRAHAALGDLEACLSDLEQAKEIGGVLAYEQEIGDALWKLGRTEEAIASLSRVFPLSNPEKLQTRGLAWYAAGDFDEAERDLSAWALVDGRNLYALMFQHLAACLSGREEMSRLALLHEDAVWQRSEWSVVLANYLLGKIDEEVVFEAATEPFQKAEAAFYVSQLKRIARDHVAEARLLEECIAIKDYRLTEHWLALNRLRDLKSATQAPHDPGA